MKGFVLFLFAFFCIGNPTLLFGNDSQFVFYIISAGKKYDRQQQKYETIIEGVFVPEETGKKLSGLNRPASSRWKIKWQMKKREKILSDFKTQIRIIHVYQPVLFKRFYPKGLKKGTLIDEQEFHRWNFIEDASPYEIIAPILPKYPPEEEKPLYWEDILIPTAIINCLIV